MAHRGQFRGNLPSVLFYYEIRWAMLETRRLCHPHIHVTILIPRGMVLGGGAWGRRLGQEGRSIRVGLVPLLRDPTQPWPSFCPGRRQGDTSGLQPGRGAMPAPWSQTSRPQNLEKYISVVSKPAGPQYSVTAARAKTGGDTSHVYPNSESKCGWLEREKE